MLWKWHEIIMFLYQGGEMTLIAQQLLDALAIMGLGMGLVFLFLSMLIGAVNLVAWKLAPSKNKPMEKVASSHEETAQISPVTLAAITAAIHQYRANV